MQKRTAAFLLAIASFATPLFAQHAFQHDSVQQQNMPWMDSSLSPDERADMVVKQMTLDEKISLMHGEGMPGWGPPLPNAWMGNGGAGFVMAIPRLGIPFIQMSDAAYGVRSSAENGRYSTAL
ncbi:MAG TPA: glycosyl hydrolase, partial [Terriglobales bacterium]